MNDTDAKDINTKWIPISDWETVTYIHASMLWKVESLGGKLLNLLKPPSASSRKRKQKRTLVGIQLHNLKEMSPLNAKWETNVEIMNVSKASPSLAITVNIFVFQKW